ncbi:MAG: hypothetical protein V3S32_02405, partial [Acidimicrobiia bacterium]
TCDGFGFVKLIAEPLETIIAKIAAALAALLTILLLIIAFTGRTRPVEVPVDTAGGEGSDAATAAGVTGAATATGVSSEDDDENDTVESHEPGTEDLPERDDLA